MTDDPITGRARSFEAIRVELLREEAARRKAKPWFRPDPDETLDPYGHDWAEEAEMFRAAPYHGRPL